MLIAALSVCCLSQRQSFSNFDHLTGIDKYLSPRERGRPQQRDHFAKEFRETKVKQLYGIRGMLLKWISSYTGHAHHPLPLPLPLPHMSRPVLHIEASTWSALDS